MQEIIVYIILTIVAAVLIYHISEVTDKNISLGLQTIDHGVKTLVTAFAVVAQMLQVL